MHWYSDLYISDNLPQDREKLKKRIQWKVYLKSIYYIVVSDVKDGQLEIINRATMTLPFFQTKEYYVIGVAKGYYHARSLVEKMFADVYNETGDCNVREYFIRRKKTPAATDEK